MFAPIRRHECSQASPPRFFGLACTTCSADFGAMTPSMRVAVPAYCTGAPGNSTNTAATMSDHPPSAEMPSDPTAATGKGHRVRIRH